MKTKIIALILFALALTVSAQTNSDNPWLRAGGDILNGLKSLTPGTNSVYTLYAGYGQNTATKQQIEAMMFTMATTNNTGIGLVGAHIGNEWKYGGATITFGRTDNWGVFGNVREFIGDGVIYDFRTHDPANYFLSGIQKDWRIGNFNIGAGAVVANRSNAQGIDIVGGGHFSFTF